jgi:hypothetical protein
MATSVFAVAVAVARYRDVARLAPLLGVLVAGGVSITYVEGRRVAIDRTTITCQGVGRAQRSDHTLAWTGFQCVQPTFPAGAVAGPDAVFDVHPTGPRSLRVAAARFAR